MTGSGRSSSKPIVQRSSGKRDTVSSKSDIASFLEKVESAGPADAHRNGLIFAMDATLSRQHTWDMALKTQSQMFDAVGETGHLDVQLVYFRGFGECRASRWVRDTKSLRDLMTAIDCRGGQTQIAKVLSHARKECGKTSGPKVRALVYVGDAMEEDPDHLSHKAGELGVLGIPAFMFQEGGDPLTETTFREISRLSGGAYMRFGAGSAAQLAQLLKAVAKYAAGGRKALSSSNTSEARKMLEQLR